MRTPIPLPASVSSLVSVSLASLLGALDMSIVNIANPAIIKSFGVSVGMGSLVILAYMLTISTLILIMGKLGDRYGFHPLLITGLVIFGIGSFLCGIAPDIYFLIGSRILQAVGATMFSAIGPAIITGFLRSLSGEVAWLPYLPLGSWFCTRPRDRRIHHPVPELELDLFLKPPGRSYRHCSWLALYPRQMPPAVQKPLQLSGLAAFILSTLCILLAFSLFQVPGTTGLTLLSLFISGIVFGLLFWQLEKRNLNPLISPALTKNRHFLGLTPCLIVTILFSGVTYLMPLYLVNSHHLDQFTAGMIMTEPALLSIIVAPIGGSLADRHGSIRVSSIALTLAAAGFLVFVTFNPVTVIIVIVAGMVVNRVSTAAFFGPKGKLIMNPCPEGTSGTVPGS